jgi:T-complex protein 1 subunit eta
LYVFQVVLSKLPIGDVATQYFADRDMFCAGRVPEEDLVRTMKACGGSIQSTVHDLDELTLGSCAFFEEKQVTSLTINCLLGHWKSHCCT